MKRAVAVKNQGFSLAIAGYSSILNRRCWEFFETGDLS